MLRADAVANNREANLLTSAVAATETNSATFITLDLMSRLSSFL